MRLLVPILLVGTAAAVTHADEIHLVGGGKISGEIVERSAQRIVVETGPGRVTLPMSRVIKVDAGPSALSEYQARSRSLEPGDTAGWVSLGQWADLRDLGTQARAAYQRALAIDPANAAANAALGRVQSQGVWLSQEEAYRAQGLVPFDGGWVTPQEREAARRERSDAELSEHAARESEARVREAEARARAAEADARRAETEATVDETSADGIPFWPYAYGGGGGSWGPPHRDPSCCRPRPEPRPTSHPPARTPPTGSLNGSSPKGDSAKPAPQAGAVQKN